MSNFTDYCKLKYSCRHGWRCTSARAIPKCWKYGEPEEPVKKKRFERSKLYIRTISGVRF